MQLCFLLDKWAAWPSVNPNFILHTSTYVSKATHIETCTLDLKSSMALKGLIIVYMWQFSACLMFIEADRDLKQ